MSKHKPAEHDAPDSKPKGKGKGKHGEEGFWITIKHGEGVGRHVFLRGVRGHETKSQRAANTAMLRHEHGVKPGHPAHTHVEAQRAQRGTPERIAKAHVLRAEYRDATQGLNRRGPKGVTRPETARAQGIIKRDIEATRGDRLKKADEAWSRVPSDQRSELRDKATKSVARQKGGARFDASGKASAKSAPSLREQAAAARKGRPTKEGPSFREARSKAESKTFAEKVHSSLGSVPKEGRSGSDKVFISHAHAAFEAKHGKIPIEPFKRKLLESQNARHLDLGRADLPEAMHAPTVKASMTKHQQGSEFHFIREKAAAHRATKGSASKD